VEKLAATENKIGFARQYYKDVTPFQEYWTFGRLNGMCKLKELPPPITLPLISFFYPLFRYNTLCNIPCNKEKYIIPSA
jgi:hypothetical protein